MSFDVAQAHELLDRLASLRGEPAPALPRCRLLTVDGRRDPNGPSVDLVYDTELTPAMLERRAAAGWALAGVGRDAEGTVARFVAR